MRRIATLAVDAGTLQAYLRTIAKFPRLTAEDERALGRRIRQLDENAALQALVESNLRFVVSYAKRYRNLGVPFLDLIHEGNLGLIEAARRFDPDSHVEFITCAAWWIRQSILHVLSEGSRASSPRAKVPVAAARFGQRVAALQVELEHAPSTQEIADRLAISEDDAQTMMALRSEEISLSHRVWIHGGRGEGVELAETLTDPAAHSIDCELTRDALVQELESAMGELDPKERQVMRLRYALHGGAPWTLQRISARLRLSRERIRQIEARAMQKLRRRKSLRSYLN